MAAKKPVIFSVIISFVLFFLVFNIIKLNVVLSIILATIAYFGILLFFERVVDTSRYDYLNTDEIRNLSDGSLTKCIYHFYAELINLRYRIKNPTIKEKVNIFLGSVGNIISNKLYYNELSKASIAVILKHFVDLTSKYSSLELIDRNIENDTVFIDRVSSSIDNLAFHMSQEGFELRKADIEEINDIMDKINMEVELKYPQRKYDI